MPKRTPPLRIIPTVYLKKKNAHLTARGRSTAPASAHHAPTRQLAPHRRTSPRSPARGLPALDENGELDLEAARRRLLLVLKERGVQLVGRS